MQGTHSRLGGTSKAAGTRIVRMIGAGALMLVMLVMLGSCAPLSELPQTDGADPGAAQAYSYNGVIELLQKGRAERAETMLQTRLEAVPGDDRARNLLHQIRVPPNEYLGEASFEYEVQSGESLSILARRFLGNPRLFFVLARYNDIEQPSLLQAGRTLRVPKDYWDGPSPPREPLGREQHAREYLAADQPRAALALYQDIEPQTLGREELTLVGNTHRRLIERALSDGDLDSARQRLYKARRQAPGDGSWQAWLDELEDRATAMAAYRRALALREGQPTAAARALQRALQADPEHARARAALAGLREEVVPAMHQEAVLAYRNQNLDEAIRLWERILSIDPDFEPARGYLTRAEELRRRLEALE